MYKLKFSSMISTIFFLTALGMPLDVRAAQEQQLTDKGQATPELLKESKKVFDDCQRNRMRSSHYDCTCVSKRFMEERARAGANVSQYNILVDISNECFDIPKAAEYALESCMGSGRAAFALSYKDGTTFEEFCQCASRNYALEFQAVDTYVTRNIMSGIKTKSLLRCQTPLPGNKNVYKRLDQ